MNRSSSEEEGNKEVLEEEDIIPVMIGGEEFPMPLVNLQEASPLFGQMIKVNKSISIPGYNPVIVLALMEHLLTSIPIQFDINNIAEYLKLSIEYEIKEVEKECIGWAIDYANESMSNLGVFFEKMSAAGIHEHISRYSESRKGTQKKSKQMQEFGKLLKHVGGKKSLNNPTELSSSAIFEKKGTMNTNGVLEINSNHYSIPKEKLKGESPQFMRILRENPAGIIKLDCGGEAEEAIISYLVKDRFRYSSSCIIELLRMSIKYEMNIFEEEIIQRIMLMQERLRMNTLNINIGEGELGKLISKYEGSVGVGREFVGVLKEVARGLNSSLSIIKEERKGEEIDQIGVDMEDIQDIQDMQEYIIPPKYNTIKMNQQPPPITRERLNMSGDCKHVEYLNTVKLATNPTIIHLLSQQLLPNDCNLHTQYTKAFCENCNLLICAECHLLHKYTHQIQVLDSLTFNTKSHIYSPLLHKFDSLTIFNLPLSLKRTTTSIKRLLKVNAVVTGKGTQSLFLMQIFNINNEAAPNIQEVFEIIEGLGGDPIVYPISYGSNNSSQEIVFECWGKSLRSTIKDIYKENAERAAESIKLLFINTIHALFSLEQRKIVLGNITPDTIFYNKQIPKFMDCDGAIYNDSASLKEITKYYPPEVEGRNNNIDNKILNKLDIYLVGTSFYEAIIQCFGMEIGSGNNTPAINLKSILKSDIHLAELLLLTMEPILKHRPSLDLFIYILNSGIKEELEKKIKLFKREIFLDDIKYNLYEIMLKNLKSGYTNSVEGGNDIQSFEGFYKALMLIHSIDSSHFKHIQFDIYIFIAKLLFQMKDDILGLEYLKMGEEMGVLAYGEGSIKILEVMENILCRIGVGEISKYSKYIKDLQKISGESLGPFHPISGRLAKSIADKYASMGRAEAKTYIDYYNMVKSLY